MRHRRSVRTGTQSKRKTEDSDGCDETVHRVVPCVAVAGAHLALVLMAPTISINDGEGIKQRGLHNGLLFRRYVDLIRQMEPRRHAPSKLGLDFSAIFEGYALRPIEQQPCRIE